MLDNGTLKLLLAAALAFVVLRVMMGTPESFEPDYDHASDYAAVVPPREGLEEAPPSGGALMAAQTRPVAACTGIDSNTLPKPASDAGFGQFAPQPGALNGQNFVDASRWVGMGNLTSRRNANRQLRPDIPVPKNNSISPWMQSTIEQTDDYQRALC